MSLPQKNLALAALSVLKVDSLCVQPVAYFRLPQTSRTNEQIFALTPGSTGLFLTRGCFLLPEPGSRGISYRDAACPAHMEGVGARDSLELPLKPLLGSCTVTLHTSIWCS